MEYLLSAKAAFLSVMGVWLHALSYSLQAIYQVSRSRISSRDSIEDISRGASENSHGDV